MLKIRDDVNLKELEKYGFEYYDNWKMYIGGYRNRELHLRIDIETREITMNEPFRDVDGEENNIELLYDLIKANLVVKVDE